MSQTVLADIRSRGGLSTVLQPIYELKQQGFHLLAVECLTRGPKDTRLHRASDLFAYAAQHGAIDELDRGCMESALESAGPLPGSPRISLNVRASTVCADDFLEYLETLLWGHGIPATRLIIEVGGLAGGAYENLASQRAALKELGARVAFDDTGFGEIDYEKFLEVRPDYLKVDSRLIHGIAQDTSRQAILRAFVSLGKKVGFQVAAEGVEDFEDLHLVGILGIEIVQGYHFTQPLPAAAWKRRERALHENFWSTRSVAV